jgi:hypothetical protein
VTPLSVCESRGLIVEEFHGHSVVVVGVDFDPFRVRVTATAEKPKGTGITWPQSAALQTAAPSQLYPCVEYPWHSLRLHSYRSSLVRLDGRDKARNHRHITPARG